MYLYKMKSKGLGDDIEKFTKFTGIKKAVRKNKRYGILF